MTTLTGYIVNPALYQSVGIEAQAGDQVELFLDQTIADPDLPISIIGTIQPGMTRTCAGTSYDIEYDETDLDESGVDLLTPDMILSAEIVSEAQVLFANAVRFDAQQNLTDEQEIIARHNIGLPELVSPAYTLSPTTMYPTDGAITDFSVASTDIPVNATGLYTYIGEYLGNPAFKKVGTNVAVTEDIFSGDGYGIFSVSDNVNCPNWTIALFTAGTADPIASEYNPEQTFLTSPDLVVFWNDVLTDTAITVTFSGVIELPSNVTGVPGQFATGYVNSRWEVFMCYQNNPTRWRQVSFNVNTLP